MSDRLLSGERGLDAVLGGGLPANGINLIMGLPGTGKTILCQQFVFANAQEKRPALYLSTVSEPFEKIIRYVQTLSFFDRAAVGRSIFYEDLGGTLGDGGLGAVLQRITALIKERRPGLIAIDSFKALAAFAADPSEFRRFLHDLAALLTAFPADCFWVGEYAEDETREAPEFAVVDAIISMSTEHRNERAMRVLEVRKLRGSGFRSGKHAYRLSEDGITVYPRLVDARSAETYRLERKRISSGIAPLDTMLSEGYWPGASTLVAGPSGAGKTLMGLHFIFQGATDGEPGVIATLQENPVQLERITRGFGWSLDQDAIQLMYRSPNDIYIDEWVYQLLECIERTGARRVLVDSLTDLQLASADPIRFREFIYSLTQRFSREGISLVMTSEIADLFHVGKLAEYGISHLSDNLLLLQYLRTGSQISRTVAILKSRATAHQQEIREFEITRRGIIVGDPVAGGEITP